MPTSKLMAMLLAAAVAITACGGDDASDATSTTTASPDADPEPDAETEADTDEDLARAEDALLDLSDLPTGWSEGSVDEDDDGNITTDAGFAACVGVDVEQLEAPDDRSFETTFTDGNESEVSSSASVWPTEAAAEERFETATGDEALDCIPDVLRSAIEEDAEDGVSVTDVEVGRINLDLPGNAVAIRMNVTIDADGFEVDVFADSVVGFVDNIGWSITSQSVFTPPDAAAIEDYAALVHGRLTGDEPAADDDSEAAEEPAAESVGSRSNPVPLGSPASLDGWDVTLQSFQLDATDTLVAADDFNDAPPEGMQYSLLRVTATYTGPEEGSPAMDLGFEVVGDDQRRYDESDCVAELSVLPEALYSEPDVFTGGVVEGNVCVLTPTSLTNPLVNVSETTDFDGDPVWLAVG